MAWQTTPTDSERFPGSSPSSRTGSSLLQELGAGRREERQSGTTGNHVLVSQGAPSIHEVLPPSSCQPGDSFVAVFGQDKEDLSKCQLLTVSRNAYRTLVEERVRVNSAFVRTTIDHQAVDSLPENGVPQQLIKCGVIWQK